MIDTARQQPAAQPAARPRLLIEDWLPAAAIGVECMRERGTGQNPPTRASTSGWACRPLIAIPRAAVLGPLLPADCYDVFERLLGFGRTSEELVEIRQMMDYGIRVQGGFNADRAFKGVLREPDLDLMTQTVGRTWADEPIVIDPMSGGGSIPLESARLGFRTLSNEYNPVACSVLEATIDYPFRFGRPLADRARHWAKAWEDRVADRLAVVYPARRLARIHAYIYARTIPCPDTGHPTPLVPDWHLLKPKSGAKVVAVPVVDTAAGTWRVEIRTVGRGAGEIATPPAPTYKGGKGVSLFTGRQIPSEYIKAMAQAGRMGSQLYAVAVKATKLAFEPPLPEDLAAIDRAAAELARLRPAWERDNIIPTELYPDVTTDPRPRVYGMPRWADMFAPRQLLAMGVLVEELRRLRPEIVAAEGEELGDAVVHLLAFVLDKFANVNALLSSWDNTRTKVRGVFDRHDFAFKATFAEMAAAVSGGGLAWAIDNTLEAYEEISKLPRDPKASPVEINLGSATSLPQIADGAIAAVVVDPPYADNVQYSELADFFYVWLKRTIGDQRPEWFSTYLSEHDHEAVVNDARFRDGTKKPAEAKAEAQAFYAGMMAEVFAEARRILRDDGVLTVMFTHKQQDAWESLFAALIAAGFSISATWPVKTESEHSLHQARKNAAQSTVLLVCRKRPDGVGVGYFDRAMRAEVRDAAREAARRLRQEGLNSVDQLVGAFGPAVAVFSRWDSVRRDTGTPVVVGEALDEAAEAVAEWRIEQLAQDGLDGVEPEGRFALLCWDVLAAGEFRFNEAKLLGHAVGMDIDTLVTAGLVTRTGDKIVMQSAQARRRDKANDALEMAELSGMPAKPGRGRKKTILQVHPNDPSFRTALDACQALALTWLEAGGGSAGIGAARGIVNRQRWTADSPVARLMAALVMAAPEALRADPAKAGKTSAAAAYPEFHAWHTLLRPLFGVEPADWTSKSPIQMALLDTADADEAEEDEVEDEE